VTEFLAGLGWRPAIGDPSVMGWLTVAAYGAAAVLCALAARNAPAGGPGTPERRERRLWIWIAALMAFLGVNKQLDLQTLFTRIGRELAVRGGWYENRRIFQFLFVLAVAAAGIWVFRVVRRGTRQVLRERKLLLFGVCFLIVFIIVRASSFHHVAALIDATVLGIRMNWVLELGGIGMIAVAAARSLRRPVTEGFGGPAA
jgi:hypothetical protein